MSTLRVWDRRSDAYHHDGRGRGGNYSESELEGWAERIEGWRERGDVYAYFNDDWQGFAIRNALCLRGRLNA